MIAAGVLVVASSFVSFGCETTVIRREGIGASTTHPTTGEPAGSDPLSRKVWGGNGSQP